MKKKIIWYFFFGISIVYSGIKDTINIDGSNAFVDSESLQSGSLNPDTWILSSREGYEKQTAYKGDLAYTRSNKPITIKIPEQSDLSLYELRLYGAGKFYDLSYSISIDGERDSLVQIEALPGSGHAYTGVYFASSILSGSAHNITIISHSADWFGLDFFVISEIPGLSDAFKGKKPGDNVEIITPGDTIFIEGASSPKIIPPETTVVFLGDTPTGEVNDDNPQPLIILGDTVFIERPLVIVPTPTNVISTGDMLGSVVSVYSMDGSLVYSSNNRFDWKRDLTEGLYIVQYERGSRLEVIH